MANLYVLNVHEHQLEVHLVDLFLHSLFPIFLTHSLLDPKPQTTQTVDRNKFSPLDSPYAPYPIPAWSAALQAVNQSPANLVEATKTMQHFGHYIFPDPGLFIHPGTAMKYIESWLRIHEAWFMRVAKEPSLALSNQSWRTYLSIDNTVPGKGDTKAARRRQETLDILLPNTDMYSGVERCSGSMGPIVWQGREYPPGVFPPRTWSERFYGSYMSSISFTNCNPWTVVLVKIWTYWALPNYLTGKLRSRNVSPRAHFYMSRFPPRTVDWLMMTSTSASGLSRD